MNTATSIYEYAKGALQVSADRPAICFFDKPMTYTELFERIDNFADHLYGLGVREGTVVTIHLPNCPQAVIAIYAVAKLGGICNMVHPQMPEEALKRNLSFTDSKVLITTDKAILTNEYAGTAIHVDVMSYLRDFAFADELNEGILEFDALLQPAGMQETIPQQKSLSGKCAVYMHSSGTTGTPKTVMLSHQAANAWVNNLRGHFHGAPVHEQVCLSVVPLYHAMGFLADMHRAISYGAQLIIMERWNCEATVSAIKTYRVTFFMGVPSIFLALLNNPNFSREGISSLHYCIIAGEHVPVDLVREVDERVGNGRVVFTAYGLTEVGGAACALSPVHHKITASGYPMANTKIMVQDDTGVIQRTGRGQLVINTDAMMMGYLKDSEATEESLLRYKDELWLKTGDFGEIDGDGYVYCLSRMKNIIIRKGNNVFPEEVERIIRGVPSVSQVCVIGLDDVKNATQTVCAVIVPHPGSDEADTRNRILAACRTHLPQYAVPETVIFRSQIPYNKTGKMDRAVLRQQL